MPGQDDLALMAHLMRRAGFGAPREELEARVAKGYEATVEELLHPESQPEFDEDLMFRYHPAMEWPGSPITAMEWPDQLDIPAGYYKASPRGEAGPFLAPALRHGQLQIG